MHRREYCILVAGVATALAGCSGLSSDDNGDTPDDTPTDTPTDTSITISNDNSADTPTPENVSSELSLEAVTVPGRVEQPNAVVPVTVEVENSGGTEGVYYGVIGTVVLDEGDLTLDIPDIEVAVPPGERTTAEVTADAEGSGVAEIRIEDETRTVAVVPADPSPRIREANLIDGWSQYGDVVDNAIEEVETETDVAIGVRYEYWTTDGVHDVEIELELYDAEGNQVFDTQERTDQPTDDDGWGVWERFVPLNSGSQPGDYTADILLRDRSTGETAETSVEFTVVE